MDKMLGKYKITRLTLLWLLAFLYNMIDVTGLAPYIISRAQSITQTKDQRKKFLKDLSKDLCLAVDTPPQVSHSIRGSTPVTGSCHVCQNQRKKQPKTRKSCVVCFLPLCDENSFSDIYVLRKSTLPLMFVF